MEKSNDELSLKILIVIESKMIILCAFQNDELQDIIKKITFPVAFCGHTVSLFKEKNINHECLIILYAQCVLSELLNR